MVVQQIVDLYCASSILVLSAKIKKEFIMNKEYNIKDMIKDKKVKFVEYRRGELIYITECGFKFPVPIDDTGDGVFLPEDKAIIFMRYIRKAVNALKL